MGEDTVSGVSSVSGVSLADLAAAAAKSLRDEAREAIARDENAYAADLLTRLDRITARWEDA
jgi:hypothetical protein